MSRYIHHYTGKDTAAFQEQFREDPMSLLHIDADEAAHIHDVITDFYQDHLTHAGMDGYVIGLSGGIDSTTTAHLLVDAVGPEHVHGIIMPASHSDPDDVQDALAVADTLDISTNEPETFRDRIDGIVDDLADIAADGAGDDEVRRGNILARARMIVLRDHAKARNALVAGTTNASERDLGYMTLAADGKGGIDNEALYDLYKTTVRQVARTLDVPDRIVEKTPTADLWQEQTDERELGHPYPVVDQVLTGLRLDMAPDTVADQVAPVDADAVTALQERVERMRFKRELAPHAAFA